MAGEGALLIPREVDCEFLDSCPPAPVSEPCVILYAECGYEGMNTKIC